MRSDLPTTGLVCGGDLGDEAAARSLVHAGATFGLARCRDHSIFVFVLLFWGFGSLRTVHAKLFIDLSIYVSTYYFVKIIRTSHNALILRLPVANYTVRA